MQLYVQLVKKILYIMKSMIKYVQRTEASNFN